MARGLGEEAASARACSAWPQATRVTTAARGGDDNQQGKLWRGWGDAGGEQGGNAAMSVLSNPIGRERDGDGALGSPSGKPRLVGGAAAAARRELRRRRGPWAASAAAVITTEAEATATGMAMAERQGDFRKKVWSMTGGPYSRPKHWCRNTAIAMAGSSSSTSPSP
ncbi:hypothetical protein ACMD2_13270 [Ananas comosus]|uniref:Uncharacterized protein n=1 Tax=Ananas comosus TaxID=4615 RepID=A0A199VMJ7_ANACO|nr:hypothetical protein ACMD2_13270 [Ananas comosus]